MATREEKKNFLKGNCKRVGSVFVYGDTETREKIEKAIENICDRELREVLRNRYICGYEWLKVAEQMYINRSTAFRWHNMALDALQIPEE